MAFVFVFVTLVFFAYIMIQARKKNKK